MGQLEDLSKGIFANYIALTYNGDNLNTICPLNDGIIPDASDYPACSYNILGSVNSWDFCNDRFNYLVQFTVWDNIDSSLRCVQIGDFIRDSYSDTTITVDGTLLRLDSIDQSKSYDIDRGWRCDLQFRILVQKQR